VVVAVVTNEDDDGLLLTTLVLSITASTPPRSATPLRVTMSENSCRQSVKRFREHAVNIIRGNMQRQYLSTCDVTRLYERERKCNNNKNPPSVTNNDGNEKPQREIAT
jgi:hypothetical protein